MTLSHNFEPEHLMTKIIGVSVLRCTNCLEIEVLDKDKIWNIPTKEGCLTDDEWTIKKLLE